MMVFEYDDHLIVVDLDESNLCTTAEELSGAGVPLVVRQVVAEPPLLLGLASGHHVEQQPAAGDPRHYPTLAVSLNEVTT